MHQLSTIAAAAVPTTGTATRTRMMKENIINIKSALHNPLPSSEAKLQKKIINGSPVSTSSGNGNHGLCSPKSDQLAIRKGASGLSRQEHLKKKTSTDDVKKGNGKRKVSWSDAYGRDLAHVHEFQSSISEEGELRDVRNSCVCAIQ